MERLNLRVIRSKKDKAFYKVIKSWLKGEDIDEVELAINLSSMLTHCLIEIKGNRASKIGLLLADELDIAYQSKSLEDLIHGKKGVEELRAEYLERFGDCFGIERS